MKQVDLIKRDKNGRATIVLFDDRVKKQANRQGLKPPTKRRGKKWKGYKKQ